MQIKTMLLAYLKTVISSTNCPGKNCMGPVCALGQLARNAAQCDRVGLRNMHPQLSEAAMLEAKVG